MGEAGPLGEDEEARAVLQEAGGSMWLIQAGSLSEWRSFGAPPARGRSKISTFVWTRSSFTKATDLASGVHESSGRDEDVVRLGPVRGRLHARRGPTT